MKLTNPGCCKNGEGGAVDARSIYLLFTEASTAAINAIETSVQTHTLIPQLNPSIGIPCEIFSLISFPILSSNAKTTNTSWWLRKIYYARPTFFDVFCTGLRYIQYICFLENVKSVQHSAQIV